MMSEANDRFSVYDGRRQQLEKVGAKMTEFTEWRGDHSRTIAQRKSELLKAQQELREMWETHQAEQQSLESRVVDWSRDNGIALPGGTIPRRSPLTIPAGVGRAAETLSGAEIPLRGHVSPHRRVEMVSSPGSSPRPALGTNGIPSAVALEPSPLARSAVQRGEAQYTQTRGAAMGTSGVVDRWDEVRLSVDGQPMSGCLLQLGASAPSLAGWESTRCVRTEPAAADYAVANASVVRGVVAVVTRDGTQATIIQQALRVQHAGGIGMLLVNGSGAVELDEAAMDAELALDADLVSIPVVVVRPNDAKNIPRGGEVVLSLSHMTVAAGEGTLDRKSVV